MPELILPGDPPIPLTLRRSGRARRISLRISQLDGRVTLTLPKGVPEREALGFAREKESWIRGHLAARGADVIVGLGTALPVGGQLHEVVPTTGRKVVFEPGRVAVPGAPDRVGRRLVGHLKTLARARLAEASDTYAARLGKPYSAITLRDARSRWGSCTAEGRLMYSWRLILAPPEVLDYVVAHEVAHLAEMNHSAAFWAQVTRIHGDYAEPRNWLRRNGSDLHRYRFERSA
ncbi:M48 family metallopeptidase [Roseobacter sinensis]|uniref:M48 family metallopeptidase n=1 Tax=Roseobacter sinensis TaxID=2931391 RepID=A0ABT3BDL3_9RHOB|nr:SprT family zinc-dependent metalloprotease [Roseobacter sp. WL0113]MCV3271672.1 M48 family metallopeptidase [Roseobacter sp. WL0113]